MSKVQMIIRFLSVIGKMGAAHADRDAGCSAVVCGAPEADAAIAGNGSSAS